MADLVGSEVVIPPSAWVPAAKGDSEGVIKKYLTPTKKFPHGRLEVKLKDEPGVYVWETDKLPRDWVVESSSPGPSSPSASTRSKRTSSKAKTPKASKKSSTTHPENEHEEGQHSASTEHSPQHQHQPAGKLSLQHNSSNAALLVAVALPAIYFGYYLSNQCGMLQRWLPLSYTAYGPLALFDSNFWCSLGFQHPLWAVNLVFFLNVDVLFWIISRIQKSTWLIDPYWTIIPPMIGLFYQNHPAAESNAVRKTITNILLWTWSIRLTHSYFRREEWQFGSREDWRLASLAKQFNRHWWWISFFANNIAQHLMLVGISTPLYAVHSSTAPWHLVWDTLATLGCIAGLGCAFAADNQLRRFMQANEQREARGEPKKLLMDEGIWCYSRHPNYFGEQLWWWSLALFAVRLGHPWMVWGTLFNSICLAQVTRMTEARMLAKPERVALFRQYQRTTSVLVPWFKKQDTKND